MNILNQSFKRPEHLKYEKFTLKTGSSIEALNNYSPASVFTSSANNQKEKSLKPFKNQSEVYHNKETSNKSHNKSIPNQNIMITA